MTNETRRPNVFEFETLHEAFLGENALDVADEA